MLSIEDIRKHAEKMDSSQLAEAIGNCYDSARRVAKLEKDGYDVLIPSNYYLDEAAVYQSILTIRFGGYTSPEARAILSKHFSTIDDETVISVARTLGLL